MLDAHRMRKSKGLHQQVYNALRGLEILVERPVGRLLRRLHSDTYSTEAAYITESIPKLAEVEIGRIYRAISEPTGAANGTVLPDSPLVFTFRACLGRMWSSCDTHVSSCHDRPIFFETLQKLYPDGILDWAMDLGHALANLHWAASVDGDGVNIILGNARVLARELPMCRLWLTDVDRCEPLQFFPHLDLNQMATAVICNPCWPLPPSMPCFRTATPRQRSSLASVWDIFSNAYLVQSGKLMQVRVSGYECSETSYPARFIDYMDALVADPPTSLNGPHFLAPFDPQYQPIPFQVSNTRHLYHEEGIIHSSPAPSISAELVDEAYTETMDSSSSLSWAILEEEACFSPDVLDGSGE